MRTKVTLLLLFLNVALFFFIFRFEREWRTEHASLETRRRVLGPESANIQFLEITSPAMAGEVRLERRGEAWHLTSPLEWPANPHAALRIVNELKFLEHEASFSVADLARNDQSLADYGLEEPQLSVSFRSGDQTTGAVGTLRIGAETPVGNRLYVLSPDGSRVHVVGRSLLDSLRLTPEELRASTFLTIPYFEVRSLSLQTAAPANLRVRVRRGEGDRWEIENPFIARASKTSVQLAINGLNALETRTFHGTERTHPELVEKARLGNRALRITLEGNNRRETLLLGSEIGTVPVPGDPTATPDLEFYARLENESADRAPIFSVAVPATLVSTLRNAQVELRERRILDLENRLVTAITLTSPTRPELSEITLQRLETSATGAGANWQIVRREPGGSPAIFPADREIVERLLQYLQFLSARDFLTEAPSRLDLEEYGLTRPERAITLAMAGAAGTPTTTVTLELGMGRGEDLVYAKLASRDSVYRVDPEILRATPVVPRSYRERLLRELPTGARITGLSLRDVTTNTVIYERKLESGITWTEALAGETPERRAAIEEILRRLQTLRARNFAQDQFPETIMVAGELRLWSYRLDTNLAFVSAEGAQPGISTLYLSDRVGGATQYVGSPDLQGGVVFEAEFALLDALWTLTQGPRDPGPPPPPAGTIVQ